MMKVLWLASTYPSVLYPFDGDYVQRHARATALFTDVELIHVVKDPLGLVTNEVKELISKDQQLTERVIYYKPFKTGIPVIDRFSSSVKYNRIFREAIKSYMLQHGTPAFVHVHIAMKAGLTALWLKRRYKVPYILTEHWGGYLQTAKPNIRDYNIVYKYFWDKIIKGARASTFVSAFLQDQLIKTYKIKNSFVIPNVVDTTVFYPAKKLPADRLRFIHVSTMIYQKNTEAILEAFALLKNAYPFELHLYGPVNQMIKAKITELALGDSVQIKGEVAQELLAKEMQQADALILYSRFETFGCVLIEANACGIPVIVSDLEVFHEIIEEGINGIFAEGENPEALSEKLKQFISQRNIFDKTVIAATTAGKYNYKKVGQQFLDLYYKIIN